MNNNSGEHEIAVLRTQIRDLQVQNAELSSQLHERKKELLFHQKISELFEISTRTLEEDYQQVVDLLPQAFRYPEQVSACLYVLGMSYGDPKAKDSHVLLSVGLKHEEQLMGVIYVAYSDEMNASTADTFLDEEKAMLTLLAQRLVDHTLRKQDTLSLLYEWTAYRELYNSMHEVLFEISTDGLILFMSAAVKEMLGYDPSELLDTQLSLYIHPEDVLRVYDSFRSLDLDNPSILEFRCLTSDARFKWCRASVFTVLQQGEKSGIRGLLSDIDELKSAQISLQHNKERLDQLVCLNANGDTISIFIL